MTLVPDVRLGVYQILSPLGSGGMGEVYRARDTKLGRDVAIKVLPASFAADPDRLARFEREARLLASLNHPNIGAIYGVEESSGVVALVLELVEGETLADRIVKGTGLPKGSGQRAQGVGLPIADALAIARQIADALDAAHERGIVHRDLKPANIVITPDGTVKVLDFGLAKAGGAGGAGEAGSDLTHSPTVIGPTIEGVLLGTAPYMSPEQARGKAVDKRTDIWAFGCVLYEMLTGRRAFPGETSSDAIARILERDPDWTALPAATPPPVRRLLERCLDKDSKRRLRDIGDARVDLVETSAALVPERVGSSLSATTWPVLGWIAAAIAIVAALVISRSSRGAPSSTLEGVKLEPLTFDSGLTTMPALSSDGRLLAYASDRAGRGDLDIWVQQIGGGPPLRLTDDPADDLMPEFSPDGSQIVFRSERDGGGLYLVPTLGGTPRRIVDDGRSPRFSPDGTRIAYWTGAWRGSPNTMTSSAFVLKLAGGAPARILPDFVGAREAVWAPDGKSLIVVARRDGTSPLSEVFDWWWVPLDNRPPVRTGALDRLDLRAGIETGVSGTMLGSWTPAGVLFSALRNLWLMPVSTETGRAGTPRPLTVGTGLYMTPTASRDSQIVFSLIEVPRVVERAPLSNDAPAVRLLSDNLVGASRPGETADGKTLLLDRHVMRAREIWLRDVTTGSERMVVRVDEGDGAINSTISPDGTRIGYVVTKIANDPSGTGFVVKAGGGVPTRICERCMVYGFLSDNRRLLVVEGQRVRAVDVTTSHAEDLLSTAAGSFVRVHVSANDRQAAFQHGGKTYVTSIVPGEPRAEAAWHVIDDPVGSGRPAGWSLDSLVVYLLLDTDGFRCLWGQRIDPSTGSLIGTPFPIRHFHRTMIQEFSTSYGSPITADGFLYGGSTMKGNLWGLAMPAPAGR